MTKPNDTTPDPADAGNGDERAEFVQEREDSDGTVEESDDSGRHVGRRPGDEFEVPANEDVPAGDKPQPLSDRDDGAQDDGSDPVTDPERGDDDAKRDKRK